MYISRARSGGVMQTEITHEELLKILTDYWNELHLNQKFHLN